jgi:hypothetical protein
VSPFAWWKRRRSQPRPVPRPEDYAIAGETWCEFVPPEPTTGVVARSMRSARDVDRLGLESAVRRAEMLRGRRPALDEQLRGAQRGAMMVEEAARQRNAMMGGCNVRAYDRMCLVHTRPVETCVLRGVTP